MGKIWVLVLDFLLKIASAEITVDRFANIAIDLVESLKKSGKVQVDHGRGDLLGPSHRY